LSSHCAFAGDSSRVLLEQRQRVQLWNMLVARMTPIQAAYAVAEGRRPEIPASTPRRLRDIITSCWDQDSHKRPSFTNIAMALVDYAKDDLLSYQCGSLDLVDCQRNVGYCRRKLYDQC